MTKAFKARLLASACLPWPGAKLIRDTIRDMTRAVFRTIRPLSLQAARFGCPCHDERHLLDNCPYHGLEARRIIHG